MRSHTHTTASRFVAQLYPDLINFACLPSGVADASNGAAAADSAAARAAASTARAAATIVQHAIAAAAAAAAVAGPVAAGAVGAAGTGTGTGAGTTSSPATAAGAGAARAPAATRADAAGRLLAEQDIPPSHLTSWSPPIAAHAERANVLPIGHLASSAHCRGWRRAAAADNAPEEPAWALSWCRAGLRWNLTECVSGCETGDDANGESMPCNSPALQNTC
mmetsp:Transcript_42622/g.103484  ORF Transcript_42622/g.103484 Transcript_42622/m.103484 type:complete len:221 (-) Transcript_42622:554-1216(-)